MISARPYRRRAIRTLTAALLGTIATTTVLPSLPLTVAGAALWTGLTADFCRRRLEATSRRMGHVAEMVVTSALIPPLAIFWRLRGAVRFRTPFL